MQFRETTIAGAWEVALQPHEDERGFFARTWCTREFAHHGLPLEYVQASVSHNGQRGTLRGLHFQWPPSREGKLVRCEQGLVHDVIVDLRPDSPTYLQHLAIELDAARGNAVFIPPGLAHGFQTLRDNTRVGYMMTDFHAPDLAATVRWDDPALDITWPLPVAVISERDQACPDFDPAHHAARFRQGEGA